MYIVCYALNLLLALCILCYSIYMVIHLIFWLSYGKKKAEAATLHIQISIIIPARNEEDTIGPCLQSILAQNYPIALTEIVVCDDYSEDNTKQAALKILGTTSARFKYITVESPFGKKKAIEAGIKASSGELIIVTDADCIAEKGWISTIVSEYEQTHANMLCGPVAIVNEANFCEKFQALEMCGLSLLSGAGIKSGLPLLSNAANIAYTRKAFDAVNGFQNIDETPSGDDTLLMFKIHKKFPGTIHYIKSRAAIVYTSAQPSWKDLFMQRIRWASKGLHSKNGLNSAVSLMVFLANILPIICFISALFHPYFIKIVLSALVLKALVDFLLLSFATYFFRKKELLLYFPIAVIIVMLYTSIIGLTANFVPYKWKGRNY